MKNRQIGTFLMVILVMSAVLILMATAKDAPAGTADPLQTTQPVQTAQPQQTAPPEDTDGAEDREPVAAQPSADPEWIPEGTEPEQTGDAAALVARILEKSDLEKTAVTRRGSEGTAQVIGAVGHPDASAVHALARIAEERKMNPIAAFWLVVYEGIYDKKEDTSGVLDTEAFSVPEREAGRYAYTDEGARQLLTDLLTLAAGIPDEVELETAVLGANLSVEPDQISFSGKDDCRYAYFSCSSEYVTHMLCFYLRGDERGEWIDDVELQMLSMRHADGDVGALEMIADRCSAQTAALMAAAELLMTGKTRAGDGAVPFGYEIGGAKATVERFTFTGDDQQGSLTNYRLRMK